MASNLRFVGAIALLAGTGFFLHARVREEVSVSRIALDIRKTSPSGRSEEHHFNPFWAHFSVARHSEIGITRMQVEAQGQEVPIGGFLNPDDRESFATAFSRALATAKAG